MGWLRKHKWLSITIVVLLLASGLYVRRYYQQTAGTITDPLIKGSIVQSVYGIGTITANHRYMVRLGVMTTINQLFVKEGDTVKKGSPLVEVDRVVYRAPFDGTVTSLPFMVGENVFAQAPILNFVNLEDRYLVVTLEQQGALLTQKGQNVRISFDTFREQTYKGTVQAVYSNESHFLARIDISQLPAKIIPGMTADVAIMIQQKNDVLLIPVAAINKSTVSLYQEHAPPRSVEIKTGIIDGAFAELISGDLKEGDRLIIRKSL